MHFIVGLHKKQKGYDSICAIIDKLTKLVYFLPVKTIYTVEMYAYIYIDEL